MFAQQTFSMQHVSRSISAKAQKDRAGATGTEVQFYDSAAASPVRLSHKDVNEGASVIVGPLNKDHIEQLSKVQNLDVPVLTLNHIPGLYKANLYQFALSPIDEAEQVVEQAIDNGHKRVIVLTPKSELGERMQGYLESALRKNGGLAIKSKQYKLLNKQLHLHCAKRNQYS
jgi:outer membrane PBP1 activator LpoA protein